MTAPSNALSRLLDALDRRTWQAGDRLPPERDLAEDLGVSRSSLRIALAELERMGRIDRHVGRGTFVTENANGAVMASLRIDPPPSPADVFELRMMVEPAIAAAAAMRASDPAIARLRTLISEGARAFDWEGWEASDKAFHSELARSSRNPLLVGVLDTVNVIRAQRAWGETRSASLNPERQTAYTSHHTAIIDAIAARDPARAATAMRTHLTAVNRAMVGDPSDPALAAILT